MNPTELFIRRPVATTLLTLGLTLAGIVAFFHLPVAPLPQVDFQTIVVQANMAGASPAVRAAALQALPKQKDMASAVDYLGKIAATDGETRDRVAAMKVLADTGRGNAQVKKILDDVMRSNSAPEVKAEAKKALDKVNK